MLGIWITLVVLGNAAKQRLKEGRGASSPCFVFVCPHLMGRVDPAVFDLGLLGVRMTIKEIVEKYLTENGFDGLCHAYAACACRIGDLMPCDEPGVHCEAGHEGPGDPDEEIEFTIIPGRRA